MFGTILSKKCNINTLCIKGKPSLGCVNIRSFSKQQKLTIDEPVDDYPNIYEDNVITLTPQQKIREWTRVYHEIRCSKWVKNHFGIPFWALHIKYIQSRYLQRMWATRMLRREGLGEIWSVKSLVHPTQIKINDNDHENENENENAYPVPFDADDLHYLFYERPPIGYITEKDKKSDNPHDRDERTIVDSVQFWFDTYSTRLYWDAFDHDNGNIIFSEVKRKEHRMRMDAKINAIRDTETNTLKPRDANKKINPYTLIPEENPKSEFIQYGGRYLSDFVDFKPQKTNKMISDSENNNKLLSDSESNSETVDVKNKKNDYRDTKGYKFNRSFAWFVGKVSGQSLEENIKDIESLEFGDKDNYAEIQRVIGERENIDLRTDLHKNKRFSGWHQLKQRMPSFKEIGIMLSLKKWSLIKSVNMVMDDYKKVFRRKSMGSSPPQISLCEFTVLDQFETSIGNFGAEHTLFSDWFVAVDNKREECDKSYGTAVILNDRLIFSGFLIHSCIEMGHRTRNRFRDFVGFVNLVSHEFEPEWDLLPYYSIGIKLRSDGRPYFLGLECLNRNKLMIFNGIISVAATPDDEWDYYEIPLHHFRPYDHGEFIQGENWMKVRYLRSIGIQAVGGTGSFKLEIAWIRAMAYEARFDVADENITFIQDIDALGIYKDDLIKFHIIQHQYFIDDFADPFRFEDNGVFDDNVYLGPPRAQRQHFSKLSPDLLRYIDVIDDIPLTEETQKYLQYYLDSDDMYMFENYLSDKLIGDTKHIQQLFKSDTISICDATNNLLYNQLKHQSKHNQYLTSNVYHNENIHMVNTKEQHIQHKTPFVFNDVKQTSNNPITILTQRRRQLLRFSLPEHLREREVGKWPHLV